ncbi:heavy metal-associated isoprenylated plant protein 3 [Coffea arabica]|uniref:Heavy metal-associated isoprenylated plant protein 3 n=1 Tax=Coffea arabica TaxID=13443 RepID=A0A6P6SYV1_COFAR
MGEKDEKKNEGEKKVTEAKNQGEKKTADGGGKKDDAQSPIVLKLDLHCEGCAKKVKRSIKHFDGVEDVKADCASNKLTVTGNVDPGWLREKVEQRTKKKVELLSPPSKKDSGGGGDKKADDKADKKSDDKKKDEPKKPKEPQVSTVVLKIRLHCDGCAHKIKRIIKKIDGVEAVVVDNEKDLVTVKGTMDAKDLTPYLKDKLKRTVDVVPPKKEAGGGDKKEKEAGGGDKKEKEKQKESSGEKGAAESKGGGGGDKGKSIEEPKVGVHKLEYHGASTSTPHTYYYYGMPVYNQSYANQDYGVSVPTMYGQGGYGTTGYVVDYRPHEPPPPPPVYLPAHDQMFSDENPNACSVM